MEVLVAPIPHAEHHRVRCVLQVLNAESDLFQAQLAQAQLRLQELLAYVDFYRALGGGWQ